MTTPKLMTTWMMPKLPTLLRGELEEITHLLNGLIIIAALGVTSINEAHLLSPELDGIGLR
tara:strand:- start:812 stop:994 length:183 start_codon:yes stop_codon:yes gene_type:complete